MRLPSFYPFILSCLLIALSSSSSFGQAHTFFANFPDYYNYELRVDSIQSIEFNSEGYRYIHGNQEMTIGCREAIRISPAFSLSLQQEGIHEIMPRHWAKKEDHKHIPGYKLLLYGYKKKHNYNDSLLLAALQDYCTYGQINYTLELSEYILFSYNYAINSAGHVRQLEELGLWTSFESALKESLKKELPSENMLYNAHQQREQNVETLKGSFYLSPSSTVQSLLPNNFKAIGVAEESSAKKLILKKNGKGKMIANYNQARSNWYRDKTLYWIDKNLLFLHVEGWGLSVYQIYAPNCLVNLKNQHAYVKKYSSN